RWEICSQEYMSKAKKYAFAPCIFFELKDLGKNEFEFRSQGGAITSDIRDSRDDVIIKSIRNGSHMPIALNKVGFNPLVPRSDKSSFFNGFEATNEELEAMQSYWLNVYSRPQNHFRFAHKGNAVIQGLWVGEQVTNFHRL